MKPKVKARVAIRGIVAQDNSICYRNPQHKDSIFTLATLVKEVMRFCRFGQSPASGKRDMIVYTTQVYSLAYENYS